MLDEVKAALLREKSNKQPEKKFIMKGYLGFVFLNSAGQVYTNAPQGVSTFCGIK